MKGAGVEESNEASPLRIVLYPSDNSILTDLLDNLVTYAVTCHMNSKQRPRPIALSPLESALPSPLSFSPKNASVSPLESALADTPAVSPLEYAVTEKGGGGRDK